MPTETALREFNAMQAQHSEDRRLANIAQGIVTTAAANRLAGIGNGPSNSELSEAVRTRKIANDSWEATYRFRHREMWP